MKKIIISSIFLISLGFMAGCSNDETITTSSDNMTQVDSISVLSLKEATDMYYDTYPNTSIYSIELEKPKKDKAEYEYKIKGFDGDKKYTVKIDGVGRKITKKEDKDLEADDNKVALELSKTIGLNEASRIAEKEDTSGFIKEWELKHDKNLGEAVWKVEIKDGMKETKIKINATNGEKISVDKD